MDKHIHAQVISDIVVERSNAIVGSNEFNTYYGSSTLLQDSIRAAFNGLGKGRDLCLPDTRVNILNQIRAWVDGHDKTNIFWLSGWAGTGKSTIARTISQEYYDRAGKGENLFTSFFFSRDEKDFRNSSKFVTGIAMQLTALEGIKKALLNADCIANLNPVAQWDKLVHTPLSNINTGSVCRKLVLVVDALDECDKQDDIRLICELLAKAQELQTIRLRVLITSRPEIDIRETFSEFLQGTYQESILHNISDNVVKKDISVFLSYKLKHSSSPDWPGKKNIDLLVQKSAGLFIWAATAYRFVIGERKLPLWVLQNRFDLLLKGNGSSANPEDKLNGIYNAVLENSFQSCTEAEKTALYKDLRNILGNIVLLFSPLPADSLANLINISGELLRQTLECLHSILDVPETQAYPIRIHHPSFRDFILDGERCKNPKLKVDGIAMHSTLANACFRIMSALLKKDICDLRLPGALSRKVPIKKIRQCLPVELEYACIHWVQHLQESNSSLLDDGDAHRFLQKYLLFWLEALSLLKRINEGITALISLERSVTIDQSPSLYAFVHDAKRFSLNFKYIIEEAPLQIYSSALFFAPEMSLVRKKFENQMLAWFTGMKTGQKYWSPVLQTLEGHSKSVGAISVSPDGKFIASASMDRTVRLWDLFTGAILRTLRGHSGSIYAIVFSPDSKLIASASHDKTVRIWNSSTGSLVNTLTEHSSLAKAAVFSMHGNFIASALHDNTIQLRNLSGELQILKGCLDLITAVVFSPDGKFIASGSFDKTVRLWNLSSKTAPQTQNDHSGAVRSVVFSPDGKLIASASDDKTVMLWNWSTEEVKPLTGHSSPVRLVVFSPDGKYLASGSLDNTVRLWDLSTATSMPTVEGHIGRAIVFSPDSKLIASTSHNNTIRLWDVIAEVELQPLTGHFDFVCAVAFSPDGKLLVSASNDMTVRLWDLSALQTMKGHSSSARLVVFSPDCKLIVSVLRDNTVKLWELSTETSLWEKRRSAMVVAVVFSPDGKFVAFVEDRKVKVFDSFTGLALKTLKNDFQNMVQAVMFSPDSKLVACKFQHTYVFWLWDSSIQKGSVLSLLTDQDLVQPVLFSRNGKILLSVAQNKVCLWDSSTGVALETLEGDLYSVDAILLSPDRRLVAPVSWDKKAKCWVLSTGMALQTTEILPDSNFITSASWENGLRIRNSFPSKVLRTLQEHSGLSFAVVFSPDRKVVASASEDNTVKLCNSSTGEVLHLLEGHSNRVCALVFSPDGKLIATASWDGTIRLWDLSTGTELQNYQNHRLLPPEANQDGPNIEISKGLVNLPPVFPNISSPQQPVTAQISLKDRWIVGPMGKIFCLPLDYQASCLDVRNSKIVLGHHSGDITIVFFDLSKIV